jgi:small-conductance mechanosensitive channel
VFLLLALIGMRLVNAWAKRFAEHPALFIDRTSAAFVGQLLQVGIAIFAITAYAHLIPALHRLAMALLASAGVLSVILGLAAQSTLGNLVAGISLLIYRPFGIGDVLTLNTAYGKETGAVSEFSLGYTKLITEDGKIILAPNSIVISSVIEKLK